MSEGRFNVEQVWPHKERKHFWKTPGKESAFYTEEQLSEINKKTRYIRTEESEVPE